MRSLRLCQPCRANHAAPTRVWREEQSLKSSHNGQLIGDMPHNWASAEFIRLVRHLLIFERGEGLDLLPGLPPEWRGPGCVTRLDKTPTRFGPVSLLLHVGENQQFTLLIERDPHWPRKPVACRLYLPPGARLTLAGVDLLVSTVGIVDLPWRADLLLRGSFV